MPFSPLAAAILEYERQPLNLLFSKIIVGFQRYSRASVEPLRLAFELGQRVHAHQVRDSGVPYLTHPLIVALLLTHQELDRETIVAAMLHDTLEDTKDSAVREEIQRLFGDAVLHLIEGVSKINKEYPDTSNLRKREETIRKMFRYAERDVRILLIKLADRLHNIITIRTKRDEAKQSRTAQETLEIFVPIAARLGVWEFKQQLEQHSLEFLQPEDVRRVEGERDALKTEAQKVTSLIVATMKRECSTREILRSVPRDVSTATLLLRPAGELHVDQTFFMHIVVPTEEDCYRTLSKLSRIWPGKTQELRDYITAPKDNGYQAVHTTLIVNGAYAVRFHILTPEMEERNLKGVTLDVAEGNFQQGFFQNIDVLDRGTKRESARYIQAIQKDVLEEKILIHHRGGQTYLPRDATALDAAFLIFPEHATRTDKILVNNRQVSLSSPLKNNDLLKVQFLHASTANIEWMQHVHTTEAALRLQRFLKQQDHQQKITFGMRVLQAEFDRYGKGDVYRVLGSARLLEKLHAESIEDVFLLVAEGLIFPADVLNAVSDRPKGMLRQTIIESALQKIFPLLGTGEASLRLHVTGQETGDFHFHDTIRSLLQQYGVRADRLSIRQRPHGWFAASMHVRARDREQLDRFFLALQGEEHISRISVPPSSALLLQLLLVLGFAAAMWLLFGSSLFSIIYQGNRSPMLYSLVLPVLIGNFFAYRFVSTYFPATRDSRWFLVLAFLANAGAVSLFAATMLTFQLDILNLSFFFPLTIIVISCLAVMYTFLQRHPASSIPIIRTPKSQWVPRQRVLGYAIRLLAVIVWGLEPLYIKYTVVNSIDPGTRVFLKAAGGMIPSIIIGIPFAIFLRYRRPLQWKIPYNYVFFLIIVGELLFAYLMNASLIYTSSTNVALLDNFAPVLCLIIAAVFWRGSIPYLREPRNIGAVFAAFVIGGLGSTLLFYNDIKFATQGHLFGDFLGTLMMLADTLLVIAMIRYINGLRENRSIALNLNIFLFALVISAPFALIGSHTLWNLSQEQILFGIGAGVLSGCGRILNFEAFRRIDGFLAHLMFNISVFITFTVEMVLLQEQTPTIILVLGGLMIVGASIAAEVINQRSERAAREKYVNTVSRSPLETRHPFAT